MSQRLIKTLKSWQAENLAMDEDDDGDGLPPPLPASPPPPPPGPITQGLRTLREASSRNHPYHHSSLDTQSESEDDCSQISQALKDLLTRSSLPSPLLDDFPSTQSNLQRLQRLRQTENDNAGQSLFFESAKEESTPGPLTQGLRRLRVEAFHTLPPRLLPLLLPLHSSSHNPRKGKEVSSFTRRSKMETLPGSRRKWKSTIPLFMTSTWKRCWQHRRLSPVRHSASLQFDPLLLLLHPAAYRRLWSFHLGLTQRPPEPLPFISVCGRAQKTRLLIPQSRPHSTASTSPCIVCNKPDQRKDTINCSKCGGKVHSVSCAGFVSHRAARLQLASFFCLHCLNTSTPLPFVNTPSVASRVVIQQSADDTLPATLDVSGATSPPTTPIATSSPRSQHHSSPDHQHLAAAAPPHLDSSSTPLSFSLDDVFSTRIPILRHCPKSARRELASLKNTVWREVLQNPDNRDAWTKAFAYSKLILFLPPGKSSFKEKSATIKNRISIFLAGNFEVLWRQATHCPTRRNTTAPPASANVRRATLLAQEGQFGKAAKALVSQGLDFDSASATTNMQALHPPAATPPPLPPPPVSPYFFNSAEVLAALHSFNSLSAGGASGMRAAHFRDAISSDRGGALLTTMTRLINLLAAGKGPHFIVPYLCGGNLFAALKKSGGHRPIAVGETIRR